MQEASAQMMELPCSLVISSSLLIIHSFCGPSLSPSLTHIRAHTHTHTHTHTPCHPPAADLVIVLSLDRWLYAYSVKCFAAFLPIFC